MVLLKLPIWRMIFASNSQWGELAISPAFSLTVVADPLFKLPFIEWWIFFLYYLLFWTCSLTFCSLRCSALFSLSPFSSSSFCKTFCFVFMTLLALSHLEGQMDRNSVHRVFSLKEQNFFFSFFPKYLIMFDFFAINRKYFLGGSFEEPRAKVKVKVLRKCQVQDGGPFLSTNTCMVLRGDNSPLRWIPF